MSATADAMAPAKTPITISWTIEPRRTDAASLLQQQVRVRRFSTRSLRRQRDVEHGERRRRRLDPDGRRAGQRPALAALLADVGRARLLEPPADDVRGPGPLRRRTRNQPPARGRRLA